MNPREEGKALPSEDSSLEEQKTSLYKVEWVIVISFLMLMASFIAIAKFQTIRYGSLLAETPLPNHEPYTVEIRGEVANPGIYKVFPGTELKKILRKSSPTRFADLKKLDLASRIEAPMLICVERLEKIEVIIQGLSAEPLSLILPAGSRVCDIKSHIPDACPNKKQIFKSRRFLKDGETIILDDLLEGLQKNNPKKRRTSGLRTASKRLAVSLNR